jgi:hypothetical protein
MAQGKLFIDYPRLNAEPQRPPVEQGLNDVVVTCLELLIATRLRRRGICLAVQSHNL